MKMIRTIEKPGRFMQSTVLKFEQKFNMHGMVECIWQFPDNARKKKTGKDFRLLAI